MGEEKLDRKKFFTAALAASVVACGKGKPEKKESQITPTPAATPEPTPVAAAEEGQIDDRPFRLGVIGCGTQTTFNLIPAALRIPGNEIVAVCDIIPSRAEQARKVAGGNAKVYTDYEKMLAEVKMDGVIVATPLNTHHDIVVAAFQHGHNVFCEKTMAMTLKECRSMLQAQARAGKVLQIGHHLRYHPIYDFAKRHYIDAGLLGERINNVHAQWNRNGSWRRQVPAEMKGMDFTRWGFESPEHLANWRLYREYSGGLMTELAAHQMDIINWFLGDRPTAVQGVGKVDWNDGRTIYDNIHLIYEYPDAVATYEGITTNSYNPFGIQAYEMFQGERGTLVLAHLSRFVGLFFLEPGADEELWMPVAHKIDTGFENIVHERHKKAIVLNGTPSPGSRLERIAGMNMDILVDFDAAKPKKTSYEIELVEFKRCSLDRKNPRMNGLVGLEIAATVLRGIEAMNTLKRIVFSPADFSPTAPK